MEMYAANNGSSFGASLTLQTSNSFRDVSFSSYLNQAEENMIRNITNQNHYRNNSEDDQELGVFGAEKYFKGEIEDVDNKNIGPQTFIHNYEIDHSFHVKRTTDETNAHTPSVRSNVSSNSRIGLLPRQNQTPRILERRTKSKSKTSINFLSRFGCNCINKKSTQIISKPPPPPPPPPPNPKLFDFDHKLTERQTRNDYFSFPVLSSNDLNSNSISSSNSNNNNNYSNSISGNLAGKVNGENNNNSNSNNNKKNRGCLSLGKKLSLLNDWDVDIPTEDEMYMPSSGMYNNDADSDSSSDLFEIESLSTTGNNSFIDHRKSESNGYAPSEVSVDWSVVTASAADFSVISDYEELRSGGGGGGRGWRISGRNDHGGGGGILSGCVSNKAVRVAGDEYKVSRGAAGGRRRLSDSMAVGSLFRGGLI